MLARKILSHSLKLILTVIFLGTVIQRIIQLIANEVGSRTYIDTNPSYPSFTICPFVYNPTIKGVAVENNHTFDDQYNN